MILPYYLAAGAVVLTVAALLAIAAIIAQDGRREPEGWQDGHLDELDGMLGREPAPVEHHARHSHVGRHRIEKRYEDCVAPDWSPLPHWVRAALAPSVHPRARELVTA